MKIHQKFEKLLELNLEKTMGTELEETMGTEMQMQIGNGCFPSLKILNLANSNFKEISGLDQL